MSPANAVASRKSTQALRILVADDNCDAAVSLAVVLRDEGHQVLEVYRGDAVLGARATKGLLERSGLLERLGPRNLAATLDDALLRAREA